MKYKQKLATVEAIQFDGDVQKIVKWFQDVSGRGALPFYSSGRQIYLLVSHPTLGDQQLMVSVGDYVVLNPDGKTLNVMDKATFEATHTLVKEKEIKEEG